MSVNEDGDYFVPLEDQRVFGAGIRRKGIRFVPSSAVADGNHEHQITHKSSDIGSRYLSIVLPQQSYDGAIEGADGNGNGDAKVLRNVQSHNSDIVTLPIEGQSRKGIDLGSTITVCAVCRQPISDKESAQKHESSIAHQVCMEHSPIPSHLDRQHVGLRYLQGYGWDPDSRKGLGAQSQGISIPVKAKEKNDTTGLRETTPETETRIPKRKTAVQVTKPRQMLNAKQVRQIETEQKKRAERLRDNFYGPDLEKYLGSSGG